MQEHGKTAEKLLEKKWQFLYTSKIANSKYKQSIKVRSDSNINNMKMKFIVAAKSSIANKFSSCFSKVLHNCVRAGAEQRTRGYAKEWEWDGACVCVSWEYWCTLRRENQACASASFKTKHAAFSGTYKMRRLITTKTSFRET